LLPPTYFSQTLVPHDSPNSPEGSPSIAPQVLEEEERARSSLALKLQHAYKELEAARRDADSEGLRAAGAFEALSHVKGEVASLSLELERETSLCKEHEERAKREGERAAVACGRVDEMSKRLQSEEVTMP